MARSPRNKKNGAASAGGFEPTPDPIETSPVQMAVDTLTGDLRDFILDRLRFEQSKRPWHERSEADQRDTVYQVEKHCHAAIKQAVELIAAQGLKTMRATLEQVVVKDGIKAVLHMSRADEERHKLMDATGATVLLVVADPEEFTGEKAPAEIKPDQAELSAGVVHSEASNGHAAPFN